MANTLISNATSITPNGSQSIPVATPASTAAERVTLGPALNGTLAAAVLVGNAGTVVANGAAIPISNSFSFQSGTFDLGNIAAADVMANTGTAAAKPSGVTVTALLDAGIANTQGDILIRNGSVWAALGPGTANQVLTTGGAAANPAWANGVLYGSTGAITTADPHVVGQIWSNSGTITISAG